MRRTFRTKVRDKAGTLNRLSIFVRRQFNIVTLCDTYIRRWHI